MRHVSAVLTALILTSCASYSGSNLKPGEARLEDVVRVMGAPAMRWQEPDGTQQLAYPRGPEGVHTYMVRIGADGRLQQITNVLEEETFARVRSGMNKSQVLKILGPSQPAWTAYYRARDELVWEWRYCDQWNELARFDVLFDGTREVVRSTMNQTEVQMGLCGNGDSCVCSR
ncbi:MAG TPA: hypothetical protein VFK88_03200 [Gallionella sp.]|nr:hypothetical protein [Gallionella sp.]